MSDAPPIGHNQPPTLAELIPPPMIKALIDAEIAPLKARAEELIGSCKRFTAAHPTIETDEQDGIAAEILAVVQRFISGSGRVEAARVALKAPILAADNAIGSLKKGPFAAVAVSVEAVASAVNRASLNYKVAKEKKIRDDALAEANRQAELSRMAEKSADTGGTMTYDDAIAAAEASDAARLVATGKAADLTRVHGGDVGTSSHTYRRVVTINDGEAHLVPRHLCLPDRALIVQAAGNAGTPIPTIAGVTIVDEPVLMVRR
jgi:hypothetical protein